MFIRSYISLQQKNSRCSPNLNLLTKNGFHPFFTLVIEGEKRLELTVSGVSCNTKSRTRTRLDCTSVFFFWACSHEALLSTAFKAMKILPFRGFLSDVYRGSSKGSFSYSA